MPGNNRFCEERRLHAVGFVSIFVGGFEGLAGVEADERFGESEVGRCEAAFVRAGANARTRACMEVGQGVRSS